MADRVGCWACYDAEAPDPDDCDRGEWPMIATLAAVRGHRLEDMVAVGCYGLAAHTVRTVFDLNALRRALARRETDRLNNL